jgi:hypothetical protein
MDARKTFILSRTLGFAIGAAITMFAILWFKGRI